ncbi:dihydroxyacetone kinase DhaM subunit [Planifilum fulgidum]|jgi:PTS hybrid protein|uniref:phosphoenolpyruvate--glycerone phosphotransferase n=1 Tax=Planifilum fulgidum TaxID=201973 RepID=A0A1I2LRM9_9BACL|nr:dihydroxyacetone kinase phosphoryl donor subunit DhaM [Planifilum fulgidum]SFF82132.1 dihydroxyacetone kinase DhaM subunit [Planifilum fulgidum]
MSYVGIVLVSHSAELAEGLKKLLKQVQPHVPVAAAGGGNEGEIGTSMEKIAAAIESVRSEKGVAVFIDLGSALLNAEMAIEGLDEPEKVRIADAPLVEGAYVAAVESGCGSSLETVLQKARKAKDMKKL